LAGEWKECVPAAGALELVHNFSLIHDDIQDRDRERHHRPTAWSIWGEAQAINAGDALLALAHQALMRLDERGVAAGQIVAAARLLDRRTLEMVEGQVLDIGFEERTDVTLDDYIEMTGKKTGALFDCALSLGAIVAGADEQMIAAFGRCGRRLGVAFQVRDDMLGAWGSVDRTGKPAASDVRRRKKTLPIVYALQHSSEPARRDLAAILAKAALTEDDVKAVLRVLDECGAEAYCAELAATNYRDAIGDSAIMRLENPAMDELRAIAAFLLDRDY
jgi:geranylgeranyl diphosphate synthase type I